MLPRVGLALRANLVCGLRPRLRCELYLGYSHPPTAIPHPPALDAPRSVRSPDPTSMQRRTAATQPLVTLSPCPHVPSRALLALVSFPWSVITKPYGLLYVYCLAANRVCVRSFVMRLGTLVGAFKMAPHRYSLSALWLAAIRRRHHGFFNARMIFAGNSNGPGSLSGPRCVQRCGWSLWFACWASCRSIGRFFGGNPATPSDQAFRQKPNFYDAVCLV